MKWDIKSDIGVVRTENQDRAAVLMHRGVLLAILCDGMGGHAGGALASSSTVATFESEFKKGVDKRQITKWFANTLEKAKREMARGARKNQELLDMGTTITASVIFHDVIYVFNAGDSRTYAYNGLLHQLTMDHNLRNYYIEKYNYSAEEAAKVMGAMALTSALGPRKTTNVNSFVLDHDDSIKYMVLTSDGIHDYVAKPKFENILAEDTTLEDKTSTLIKQAIRGKSSDNLTIIIVDLKG